jgi:hypothetical protein
MIELARVLFDDENGAAKSVLLPVDAAPAPGDTLRLSDGRAITVLVVESDPEHPGRVTVIGDLQTQGACSAG